MTAAPGRQKSVAAGGKRKAQCQTVYRKGGRACDTVGVYRCGDDNFVSVPKKTCREFVLCLMYLRRKSNIAITAEGCVWIRSR